MLNQLGGTLAALAAFTPHHRHRRRGPNTPAVAHMCSKHANLLPADWLQENIFGRRVDGRK